MKLSRIHPGDLKYEGKPYMFSSGTPRCAVCDCKLQNLQGHRYKVLVEDFPVPTTRWCLICADCKSGVDAALAGNAAQTVTVEAAAITGSPCDRCGNKLSRMIPLVAAHEKSMLCDVCATTARGFLGSRPEVKQDVPQLSPRKIVRGDYVLLKAGGQAHTSYMDVYVGKAARVNTMSGGPFFETSASGSYCWDVNVHSPLPRVGDEVVLCHTTRKSLGTVFPDHFPGKQGFIRKVHDREGVIIAELDNGIVWPLADTELVATTSDEDRTGLVDRFMHAHTTWSSRRNVCSSCGWCDDRKDCRRCSGDMINILSLIRRAAPFSKLVSRMIEDSWGRQESVRHDWYKDLLTAERLTGPATEPVPTVSSGNSCGVCNKEGYIPTHRFVKLGDDLSYLCTECWDRFCNWRFDKSKEGI